MPMTAITRITVHTEVTTTGVDALACKGTLGGRGTELGKFPDDWHEGETGEEGLEEDEEVVGFELWRVGASEELRIKLYKSGMPDAMHNKVSGGNYMMRSTTFLVQDALPPPPPPHQRPDKLRACFKSWHGESQV